MKILNSGFLGSPSKMFHTGFCSISIVNYNCKVSEDWHLHEKTHLSFILQGGNQESRKNCDIQASPGKIMLYHKGEHHRNRYTQFPSKNLNLELEDSFLEDGNLDLSNLNEPYSKDVDNLFGMLKIYRELHLNDPFSSNSIYPSLLELFDSKKTRLSTRPPWLDSIKEILYDRWNEFVSVPELSNLLQMHPVTISKYFRKYFNCTLADYMRKIKVERAIHFLLHTKMSITEIAFLCGFSDQSHFIRVFKVYTGFRPTQIRRI